MLIKYDLRGNNVVSQSVTATYSGVLTVEYVNGTDQALMVIKNPEIGRKNFTEIICSFSFFDGQGTSAVCSNANTTGFFDITKYEIVDDTVTMNATFEMIMGGGQFVVKNGSLTDLNFTI